MAAPRAFRPFAPADGPAWLPRFADSIADLFRRIMPQPLRLKDYETAALPAAADFAGGLVWNATSLRVAWSDGTGWTEPQPADAKLDAIAALAPAANQVIYWTGATTAALTGLTAFGRSLIDDADAGSARGTMGLGTAATQNIGTAGASVPLLNGANSWSATQTWSVDGTINGRAAGSGGQTGSTVFGGTVTGTNSVAVGSGAACTGTSSLAFGRLATAAGSGIAFGENASSNIGIAIGRDATTGGFNAIVLGRAATATASAQIVIGSGSVTYSMMIIGKGVTDASPGMATYRMTDAAGSDGAGGTLRIDASAGTGSGTPGTIVLRTASAGASGTIPQTLATRATVSPDGLDVVGLARCDSLRIDQNPAAETVTCTHTITISANGTNWKIPIVAA